MLLVGLDVLVLLLVLLEALVGHNSSFLKGSA
jgi:hypothetical protein